MYDPITTNTDDTQGPSPGGSGSRADWRDMRRAERRERRGHRHGQWNGLPIGGMILLAVGVIFLAGNFGFHLPERWWAILILIPAAATLVTAVRFYHAAGTMTGRAWGAALVGVLMLAISLALFFGANWGMFWPVILIIIGLGAVARNWRRG